MKCQYQPVTSKMISCEFSGRCSRGASASRKQRENPTKQVHAVHSRQQINERAAWACPYVKAAGRNSRQASHCMVKKLRPKKTVTVSHEILGSLPAEVPGNDAKRTRATSRATWRRASAIVKLLTRSTQVLINSKLGNRTGINREPARPFADPASGVPDARSTRW